ncbi:MAG: alanine racemase [Epsilonproteobacteria bacterium]|nr:MAG: alanine racemase [Campylobacterota bacterium]
MAFITLNKDNFFYNLNQIALKIGSVDKIALVLKDNAYGHGLQETAGLAHEFGICHAVVRSRQEAEQIRSLFDTVLVLGDKAVWSDNCSFVLNSLEDITAAEKGSKVELKVDTGMHRNGIPMEELPKALELISERALDLVGLMTHFRSADELGSELFWQQKYFEQVKAMVYEAGFADIRIHSRNSAATLRMNQCREDLVRIGIAAYGYNELASSFDRVALKPVLSLYAQRVSTRQLKKGERIGYFGDFTAPKNMIVSTYDIGYGDGWRRGDSTDPYITAEGVPILGRVSMDFITLETGEDEVCIMANAQKAAQHFGTISYEMSTALSPLIDRIII